MKTLIVVVAVVFLILLVIIVGFIYKFFQMVLKNIERSNVKRIEMHKDFEQMKHEVEDRQRRSR